MSDLAPEIRRVLREHARLPVDIDTLDDQADLFRAGMSSHASVNVMLALEDAFDIEFPDSMLKRSVFESVAGIDAGVRKIADEAAAGHADEVDRDARFPREAVDALRAAGALSAQVPEEF